jgi:hypothetical protein
MKWSIGKSGRTVMWDIDLHRSNAGEVQAWLLSAGVVIDRIPPVEADGTWCDLYQFAWEVFRVRQASN